MSSGGLTPEEQSAMDDLTSFINKYVALPVQHTHDVEEVVRSVHDIQYRMSARMARRYYPDYWRNEDDS